MPAKYRKPNKQMLEVTERVVRNGVGDVDKENHRARGILIVEQAEESHLMRNVTAER